MIDHTGEAGGWGTRGDRTANIRQMELTANLWIWKVLRHGDTCPQLLEVTS